MSEVSISAKAYCKMILHAAKYPHCSINGVLLSKSTTKGKEMEFVDAIPLFHISLNLTPMAEIALMQIDEVASQRGLVISGYYTANENLLVNSFDKAQNRVSEKIALNYPNACLFVIENSQLNLDLESLSLKVAQASDGVYRLIDIRCVSLNPNNTLDVCSQLLEKNCFDLLVDFDNHLDNIKLEWMNQELNKEIEHVVSDLN